MKKVSLIIVASMLLSLSAIAQATKSPPPSQTIQQANFEKEGESIQAKKTLKRINKAKRKAARQEMRNLRKIKKVEKRKEKRNQKNVF